MVNPKYVRIAHYLKRHYIKYCWRNYAYPSRSGNDINIRNYYVNCRYRIGVFNTICRLYPEQDCEQIMKVKHCAVVISLCVAGVFAYHSPNNGYSVGETGIFVTLCSFMLLWGLSE